MVYGRLFSLWTCASRQSTEQTEWLNKRLLQNGKGGDPPIDLANV